MTTNHPRNTRPMLSSPRCGAKTRSGKPCLAPASAAKNAAGCMAVRQGPVHLGATRTHSSMDGLRAKPALNVSPCSRCCESHAH